ncbi:hypothetical protein AAG570_011124 [Ranatra chinensis]|uniref:Rho-GAP domain-containing protein n=1 Tax=Ranatra chinensis TaxID=642074 RepID=A0ABD0YJV0_9HEMI
MRRPNLCNNSVGVADDAYKPTQHSNKEEGRVSLMRRVLGGATRKKEAANSTTQVQKPLFGVPLGDLPLTNHMVPKILHRMCTFIDIYGMNVEGLFCLTTSNIPPVVERLKLQFNVEGDADLESCTNDASAVASLLKIWLKDLPQPLLSQELTSELVTLMHKYDGDTWWGPVCFENISTSGVLPTTVLDSVLRLLYNYTNKHPATLTYIPGVFCPLLTCGEFRGVATPDTAQLTAKLIQDYNFIFNKR